MLLVLLLLLLLVVVVEELLNLTRRWSEEDCDESSLSDV